MKILVTGAAGFIGFSLCKALLQKNIEVVGMDSLNNYYDVNYKYRRLEILKHKKFTFIKDDINNINDHRLNDLDIIVNLAAQPGVRTSYQKYSTYQHNNINGFNEVLLFALHRKIKNIIYASSSSVYTEKNTLPFSENQQLNSQKSFYGMSKYINEIQAKFFSKKYGINSIGLRFFTVYGEFGRPDMAYFLFTEKIKNQKIIQLYNEGQMSRDMTYIDDIVEGILLSVKKIINSQFKGSEIYNLGNSYPVKTIHLLNTIEKILNKKAKIEHIATNEEITDTLSNNAKSNKYLDFQPKTPLNTGIEKFINWYKKYH